MNANPTILDTTQVREAGLVGAGRATTSDPSSNRPPSAGHRRLVLGLLVSAQFVVMADTSIVNVALPSIQRDLGLGPVGAAWVVNAYVLAYGGLLLLSGRIADLCGRRRMFVIGSLVFTAGTLLAAAATGVWLLAIGRIVQGVGASALSPAALSLLMLSFPGDRRARAMSVWGAASTLGGMTGVVTGGLLAAALGWRAVFLVTVPVSLLAVVCVRRVVPAGPAGLSRRRLDGWGAASLTGAIVALVHGALGAADHGWTAPAVTSSLVASALLLVVFVVVERRTTDPLVPLELFGSRVLSIGVVLAVLGGAARASTFVLVALFLQQGLTMAPSTAGLAMAPTSLMGFLVSIAFLPRLLRAFGPQRTLVAGLVVLACGHLWLALAPADAGYAVAVLPGLMFVATGVAMSFMPTTMVITAAVPAAHGGLASGMAGSATQVGAALGTATFTAIGLAVGGGGSGAITPTGFSAAFLAAAGVALVTATVGSRLR
ncbi:MAG TPA: MFS transporter [Nocardioides sp.]|uniref:MFS transporter n=1 Tax=Nocardioides sp. TaxID=35761 RepID=UPI002B96623D|nr:MFS transporter [Nocardioides sp.]HQR25959.1 MFS transporter [Nocardioides sp.]